jgi:hypothetical protein
MTLANKVAQFNADADKVNRITHGDDSTVVQTASGPVRSLAKLIKDNDAAINAAGLLGQVNSATVAALAARDAALIQAGVYATEALGRAAVADGQAFKVQGHGDVAAYEYRRTNSDASVLIAAYPSASALIGPSRTLFLMPGKNLFDKTAATLGKYLTETGLLADNPVYNVSDYIAVTPGDTYFANTSGMRYSCYFDRDKIVRVGGSDVGTSPFVVPQGISYVRVTLFASDMEVFQLERGPTSAYEPFQYRLALPNGVPIVPLAASLPAGWLPGDKI